MYNEYKVNHKYTNIISKRNHSYREKLELFSIYISQNEAFLYNKTYLLDSIDCFFYQIKLFRKKEDFVKKLISKINKTNKYKWVLIIDNVFVIKNYEFNYLIDVIQEIPDLEIYLNQFSLFSLSQKNITIRLCVFSKLNGIKYYVKTMKQNDKVVQKINNFINFFIEKV